jgi:hypothetical protein
MIIRHAEKPDGSAGSPGIDDAGQEDSHSLTAVGRARARALATLFDPPGARAPRAGLTRPTALFAAAPDGHEELRPSQTLEPLAARLHLTMDTDFSKGDEEDLARRLLSGHGAVLVCWQHEAIPRIVEDLGAITPTPPRHWPDSRYDLVWVFTRVGTGWRFSQVPQLLLPGDTATPAGQGTSSPTDPQRLP